HPVGMFVHRADTLSDTAAGSIPNSNQSGGTMEPLALVREELTGAVALGTRTLDKPEVLDLEEFDQKLRALNGTCREAFQISLRGQAEEIARKLEKGQPLDEDERNTLEMLFA